MTTGVIVALAIGIVSIAGRRSWPQKFKKKIFQSAGFGIFISYTTYKEKKFNREIESNIYAEKMKFGSRSVKEAARKAANKNKVSHNSKKPVVSIF